MNKENYAENEKINKVIFALQELREFHAEKLQAKDAEINQIYNWLTRLIDVSKICLSNKEPSKEYDKLMFQLESKLKNRRSKELSAQSVPEIERKSLEDTSVSPRAFSSEKGLIEQELLKEVSEFFESDDCDKDLLDVIKEVFAKHKSEELK